MESLFGSKPEPAPIIPPPPPPPTVDAASEHQVVGDKLKQRKGRLATDLSGGAGRAAGGRVGVYKALGGV